MAKAVPIQRALISVSDKDGIISFAMALADLGIEIISTGNSAKILSEHHIPVIEVADFTGFPEIMDGRVKTLHPKVFAGILARRGVDDELIHELELKTIDLVVVNLYPFTKIISQEHSINDAIENIDIGGPSMLRAAAKNHHDVAVLCDPRDYQAIADELMQNHGQISPATRFKLAQKAFAHTANYDAQITNYFTKLDYNNDQYQATASSFPAIFTTQWQKVEDLRYGENPQQQAALYVASDKSVASNGELARARQLQGKPLSFNNLADADSAWQCVNQFDQPSCVIVKHANPCGVASHENLVTAYRHAFDCDSTSAFGGIIACNQTLDQDTAQAIIAKQFVEVVVAPEFTQEALIEFNKKPNIRVLACGEFARQRTNLMLDFKCIQGGMLLQQCDNRDIDFSDLKVVTQCEPSNEQIKDLLFAWRVAKFVKSNAIVYARHEVTIGIGAGQMSRIDSAQIAAHKAQQAGLGLTKAVMASDAFFPFRDSVDTAAAQKISAIIQPGGSIRDEEVIAAADEAGIAMVFTGVRHFRH